VQLHLHIHGGDQIMSWASHLTEFYTSLRPVPLPGKVETLFPFADPETGRIVRAFFNRFYDDSDPRRLILGINPGRFGAGVTGVNFTAPWQLKQELGIEHPFSDKSELSAEFIYKMIAAYGGPELFYHHYFIGSVSPLGFIREGLNLNYYDDKELLQTLTPSIAEGIAKLVSYGFERDKCFCIGGDKNFRFLEKLNGEHGFFKEIISLPHPRFIMQYRRKRVEEYVELYLEKLKA